jgi:hypothetical protein
VHDPIKSTMDHLPPDYTFGVKCKEDLIGVCQLVGNTHAPKPRPTEKDKTKRPPAGVQTHHTDDLDQHKHITPKLSPLEGMDISQRQDSCA